MTNAAQTLGKFRIVDQLGSGGFATVYQAVDTSLDRDVALKVLHPQLLADVTFVQRFKREARTVANLRHPNIITVYEVGEIEDRLFLAMELARGPSLATLIKERGRIPWKETLVLLEQLCEGLEHAHEQGIVHRDLKPSNVLIDDERAMLSDFGFARALGQSSLGLSMSGGIVGTPGYIAPEVWDLNTAEVPADIYALGCITYEMLTGNVLFTGATPMQAMRAHDKGPQFPDVWPDDVPAAGIEAVLNRALAQRPSGRYASAKGFLTALKALDATEQPTQTTVPAPQEPETVAPAMQETPPAPAVPRLAPDTPAVTTTPARRSLSKWALGFGALLVIVLLAGGVFAMGRRGSGESSPLAVQSATEPDGGSEAVRAVMPTSTSGAASTVEPTDTPEPTATPEPPSPTTTGTSAPAEPTQEPAPADEEAGSRGQVTHSVQSGETLAVIANLYGVTVEDISAANPGVDSNQLTIGQELAIPDPSETPMPAGGDEQSELANTPTPLPTIPPTATAPPSDPNLLDFEVPSTWRTGDQKNGTMVVAGEEVQSGSGAGKISYDFASTANDFVVFTSSSRVPWSGRPGAVGAWVYGDGAGHFLNAWIADSSGQTWQVPLGRITHTGWQQMRGLIQTEQDWPWALIAGPEDDESLDYPLTLTAIVLDDTPDTYVGSGVIYIDDVEAMEQEQ